MQNYIEKIKDWLSAIKKGRNSYDRVGIRPKRDWQIILSITTGILVVLVLVAGYFYVQVDKGYIFNIASDQVENQIKINKNLLDKTVGDINERKKDFDAAKQGGVVPNDPSI